MSAVGVVLVTLAWLVPDGTVVLRALDRPLVDLDVTAELGAIEAPTLLFCGELDEVTPATVAQAHTGIPGSQFIVLPGCSHMAQAERPDLTVGLVRGWLAGVEASLRG